MTEAATVYFAYGSNLWREQMNLRCPENNFLGVGLLKEWRWIINGRGYANIVPSKTGDDVYGLLYKINGVDEKVLDLYEGIPTSYQKKILPVMILGTDNKDNTMINCLVYVDTERVLDSIPKDEYIGRMNKGITDAVKEGVPKNYVDKYLRRYIPDEH
ncbi:Butirosin biosynthesis, BtrG-like protein [Desarmillaria tabescens]|uniref:gamma-glutamylcyclotransferase n=1 Tax=Armillaria tabescens TaxID=1929756 RepID=A0AA39NE29_ARMTA|nr:Butirosin biosynthesis, BtrG-like protein [Desarmillaria tabescens]KAK0463914.1 Butirosin biosynthesis, BtrG-like protein [Desarmillaria tabescens]